MKKDNTTHKILSKLKEILIRVIFVTVFLLICSPLILVMIGVIFNAGKLWQIFSVVLIIPTFIALILIYAYVFRVPRKRSKFCNKLKKECKKNGCRIIYERGFYRSLHWAETDDVDLIIKAGEVTYYVKLFAARHKLSEVVFSAGEFVYKKLRLKNNFTQTFDLKPKTRTQKILFPAIAEKERSVKAIVLNPVPKEAFKKELGGGIEYSGNNDKIFGYTVYTGSGFIEELSRNR